MIKNCCLGVSKLKRGSSFITAAVLAFSAGLASAQTADDVVQVLTGDPAGLGAAVAEYCAASDDADRDTQIAVGAGFAQAYQYYASIGDTANAGVVGQVACTCERTPGEILSSYLASMGETENEACSTPRRADSSDSTPGLWKFTRTGGSVTEN
jgi:siroheme synthase